MNIMWHYLDVRGAVIKAIKDYPTMEYIIQSKDEFIKNTHSDLETIGSPALSDMPKGPHNPKSNENRIISALDKIDLMENRYEHAMEYMKWFNPSWEQLSKDEQFVLKAYYWNDGMKMTNVIDDICERLKIERSSAYNKKNRALNHLMLLLYGA